MADDEVNTTLSPWQKVVAPLAEMVGAAGGVGSVNTCVNELETQPAEELNTMVYDPAAKPVIDAGKVTPFIEPTALPLQSTVPEPEPFSAITPVEVPQVVGLVTVPTEITGVGFTVTTVASEVAEQPLTLVNVTAYEPLAETVMDCVVSPVDHVFPVADEEVNTTFPPEQNVAGPPAETVGVDGGVGSFSPCETILDTHPDALVNVTE